VAKGRLELSMVFKKSVFKSVSFGCGVVDKYLERFQAMTRFSAESWVNSHVCPSGSY
jgi:hypothetical protein